MNILYKPFKIIVLKIFTFCIFNDLSMKLVPILKSFVVASSFSFVNGVVYKITKIKNKQMENYAVVHDC